MGAETPLSATNGGGHLEKDMIDDARLWRMALRIDHKSIAVAVTSTVQDNSLIYRTIQLDEAASSWQSAIEDAVYANPLLLSDFQSIDIALDTERFTVVPDEITDPAVQTGITDSLFADKADKEEATVTVADRISGTGATLLMVVPAAVDNFIRRTFFNARVRHCTGVLTQYFHTRSSMGNSGKMFVHLNNESVTMVSFTSTGLAMANRLKINTTADAIYYILASRQELTAQGHENDQILVSGNAAMRDEAMPTLREYVPYVMPLFFPASLLKAGHEAIQAPLELSVMHLCE